MAENIGPCECCGSSSNTTTGTTQEATSSPTTGTGTTSEETSSPTTAVNCCEDWSDQLLPHPIDVTLSNPASCECGGDGSGDLMGRGDGTFDNTGDEIVICEPGDCVGADTTTSEPCQFEGLFLHLEVQCPSVSSSGNWRLIWTLSGECSANGEIDANSVECDDASFLVSFGPIGGIPSDDCCDCDCDGNGGTGSGSWSIDFQSS